MNYFIFSLLLLMPLNSNNMEYLIKKITTIKPIVGLVCGSAYSCGYMIASATSYLMCSEGSNIGSIGAIVELQKFRDLHLAANPNNNLDAAIDVEIWTGGTYKG